MINFITSRNEKIAVYKHSGESIGVVYVSGYRNVMQDNPKTELLKTFCKQNDMPFVDFDYAGWGQSGNDQREWAVDNWIENTVDVIDQCVDFPAILVGYSMGGYIMLAAALARKAKVHAMVGIAAGFGDYIQETGRHDICYEPENVKINLALENDGHSTFHQISDRLDIHCPIHCVHGMDDDLVHWQCSKNLIENVSSSNGTLELIKGCQHNMARDEDMQPVLEAILKHRKISS